MCTKLILQQKIFQLFTDKILPTKVKKIVRWLVYRIIAVLSDIISDQRDKL